MYYLLFFFLATAAVVMFLLAVWTKNFTISLVSMLLNFAMTYGAMAIEVPKFFYDQTSEKIVEHIYTVQSIPAAAIFMLLGIISLLYAFIIPFQAAQSLGKKEDNLKV